MIGERRLDDSEAGMQLLHHRQRLSGRVRDHVRVREPVLLELPIEDLDLKLKRSGISGAPDYSLLRTHTRQAQALVTEASEVKTAEHVAEFVLIAELLVPVGL